VNRRSLLKQIAGAALGPVRISHAADSTLESHFPNRLYQFVWRNWELANLDRMSRVAHAPPQALSDLGASMGLPRKPRLTSDQLRRIYITVIRQNWRLLPLEQITELLGWPREKLEFTLKEDDFLDVKLGPKPACAPVTWSRPTAAEQRRATEIRKLLQSTIGKELSLPGEPAFAFVERLSQLDRPSREAIRNDRIETEGPVPEALLAIVRRHLGSARLLLRIDPMLPASTFFMEGSTLAAGSPDALFQAVRWLQDETEPAPTRRMERSIAWDPRYLYSYFALYGDPLMEQDIDPFPDGYLEKLGRAGINGVWMQCVLNAMAPSRTFPEFGKGSDQRLANLNKLVERAARSGLKVYLYLNEPRAGKPELFARHPEIKGAESRGLYARCTTPPIVREWSSGSVAHIFEKVPELGGVFCITMSENLTNCFSKFHPETCPRCTGRTSWDVVGEVIEAIRAGVRQSSKHADVIVWDWGWPEDMCRELIPKLPLDTRLLSVSEWSIPIERGGVATEVGEYSMSVVGPGPRAADNWRRAKDAGVQSMAKAQFNNTWEISAVP